MSNGPLEAVSGLINVALGRARGFRGLEYLMNVICVVAGNLRRLLPSPWGRGRYGKSSSWTRVIADRQPAGRRWHPFRKLAEYGNCSGRFAPQVGQFWLEFGHLQFSNRSNRFRVDTKARAVPACQMESHQTT